MKLALIDLECTCDSPENLPRDELEIIEIGLCILLFDGVNVSIGESKQIYVQPVVHPELTEFCIELTGIRQEVVNKAALFKSAIEELNQLVADDSIKAWGSWGKFDLTQLTIELERNNLHSPCLDIPHVNVKQVFARKRKHRVGLGRALQLSNMVFEGHAHSGVDDAFNIARLIQQDALLLEGVYKKLSGAI